MGYQPSSISRSEHNEIDTKSAVPFTDRSPADHLRGHHGGGLAAGVGAA
jgi:hypothetical protein